MSDFKDLLTDIAAEQNSAAIVQEQSSDEPLIITEKAKPFDIALFANELKEKSELKNKEYLTHYNGNITAYSIAADCISAVVKKIAGHPVRSFADNWLPLLMRSTIGTAIHDFIQNNTKQFTETEVSLKVPSKRFSGRIDNVGGSNLLSEIKGVPFSNYAKKDYKTILEKGQPRITDFYQLMCYYYFIMFHLEECKKTETRTPGPKLDKYDIDTLQFIYIAHDLCASDMENISEAVSFQKKLKKQLKSFHNQFYFMTTFTIKTDQFDVAGVCKQIEEKLERINWYVDNSKYPPSDDPFIDHSNCFYCRYGHDCQVRK
jgi:hypothetical protein